MATWKSVKLKDPVTGDYLIPLGGNFQGGDADTLQGHAADYFATKDQYDQLFQSVSEGKASIADAITDKGGSASATDSFAQLAAAIAAFQLGINTDDATAVASQILSGYTAYAKGQKVIGSMVDRGSPSQALKAGGSYNISPGYYSGGQITANSLASQTSATAAASDILSGKTAYVNGNRISGTMVNRGAVSQTISPGGSYTIPAGYHNGSGKVKAGKGIEITSNGLSDYFKSHGTSVNRINPESTSSPSNFVSDYELTIPLSAIIWMNVKSYTCFDGSGNLYYKSSLVGDYTIILDSNIEINDSTSPLYFYYHKYSSGTDSVGLTRIGNKITLNMRDNTSGYEALDVYCYYIIP